MSWYSATYQRRAAITVHNSAGAATGDVDITIPTDWDEFWDAIDAAGAELRLTYADGLTPVAAYDVDKPGGGAFSQATRAGRLRMDGVTLVATANTTTCFWVYFDAAGEADGSTAVTMTSIITGHIELGRPTEDVYVAQPHPPGLTRPRQIRSKSTLETRHIWVDFTPLLQQRQRSYANRMHYEELWTILMACKDQAGASYTAMLSHADARFVEVGAGRSGQRRIFVRIPITAGVSGTNYTLYTQIDTQTPASTATHRRLDERFGVRVIDALEEAS